MTLPIIDSILRGDLRPNLIVESIDDKSLRERMQVLRSIKDGVDLIMRESKMEEALRDVVSLTPIYEDDRRIRRAADKVARMGVMEAASYTYISNQVMIAGVFVPEPLSSPMLRFYDMLIGKELERTMSALRYLHQAAKDDAYTRTTIKDLFRQIRIYCEEAWGWTESRDVMTMVTNRLTEFYFSLYHTYQILLEKTDIDFENNFSDFVYGWKGCDPSKEELCAYQEQCVKKEPIEDAPKAAEQVLENVQPEEKPLDKADKLLKDMEEYQLEECPKLKALGSRKKIHDYVMLGLETPAHACAMMEYLEVYSWIKSQRIKYSKESYEKLCTRVILGNEGQGYHNYLMSLKPENTNAEKYKAYMYVETCKTDYNRIQNEL